MQDEPSPGEVSARSRTGFTLSLRDLFVLIACVAAVCALFIPAVLSAREAARRMSCNNNLKQIILAIDNYEATMKTFPRSFWPHSGLNWTLSIFPYIEASSLYFRVSQATDPYYSVGKNDPHGLTCIPSYLCPSSSIERMELSPPSDVSLLDLVPPQTGKSPFTQHYYGINGATGLRPDGDGMFPLASPLRFEGAGIAGNGFFQWNTSVRKADIKDGLTYTLALGEMSWESTKYGTRYRSWLHGGTDGSYAAGARNIARPINSHKKGSVLKPFNDMPMGSQHKGGTNFAFADGHVAFISSDINFNTYQAMATRDDREDVSAAKNLYAR